jgi:CheY-like chemotaxis protein
MIDSTASVLQNQKGWIVSANQDLTGWNILLVDDDPGGLDVLQELLSYFGATAKTAWNGQKALELIKEEQFNLIITDLSMPIMDGLQLTKAIKSNPETAQIPVIVLTAHTLDQQSDNAKEAGCDALMTKPINPLTLVSELKALLPNHFGKSDES